MSRLIMIKKSASTLIAALMVLQLVLSPFTFAQTGEQQELPPQPDLEVCQLPRQDYKNFSNFRLAYHAAIVDNNPVFAQDHFQSMQDILTTHCSAVASIVQVQAEDLDEQCNALVNHLLAKNNYYISTGRTDDAIATQALIQTVLLAQDCAPIIQPASELAIDLVEQEVIANQTIDPALEVIPYKENVCFNDYGPSHTFRQQVESIQDPTVAVSVFDTVTNYFNQLGAVAVDAIQQQREGTLLAYAKNLLGWKKTSLQPLNYIQQIAPFQVAEVVDLASSMTNADGLTAVAAVMDSYLPAVGTYLDKISNYPLRSAFDQPRMQAIFTSLATEPISLTRDEGSQTFSHTVGEKGLQIVFPAIITQEPDPMDPALLIDIVQQEELIINLLDVQGTSEMVEVTNDKTGEVAIEEKYTTTKVVADIRYAGEKITAVDASIQYDEAGNMTAMQIAWYLDPYIYTNNFTKTTTVDVAGNTIEDVTMDIRIFGPAGCDVQLAIDTTTTIDQTDTESSVESIVLVLNNTRVEFNTQNFGDMWKDIQDYRATVATATSTPQTDDYLVDAKVYFKGNYMGYLFPENNGWSLGFSDPEELPISFTQTYRNPAIQNNPIVTDTVMSLRSLLEGVFTDKPVVQPENVVAGCMDSLASNYSPRATQDDGSCSYDDNGYGSGEQTPEPKPETGTGDQTPDPEAGTGDQTPDPEVGTGDEGGSGYQEIPGCTNPAATNYNAEANFDDNSCIIAGCMDTEALNYNSIANENSGCEYSDEYRDDESNW